MRTRKRRSKLPKLGSVFLFSVESFISKYFSYLRETVNITSNCVLNEIQRIKTTSQKM